MFELYGDLFSVFLVNAYGIYPESASCPTFRAFGLHPRRMVQELMEIFLDNKFPSIDPYGRLRIWRAPMVGKSSIAIFFCRFPSHGLHRTPDWISFERVDCHYTHLALWIVEVLITIRWFFLRLRPCLHFFVRYCRGKVNFWSRGSAHRDFISRSYRDSHVFVVVDSL